jgi:demethylspheroidene O-methyltransferase
MTVDIMRYMGPAHKVKALSAAFETGLAALLLRGPQPVSSLPGRLGLTPEGAALLLRCLRSFGLTRERGGQVRPGAEFGRDLRARGELLRSVVSYMEAVYRDLDSFGPLLRGGRGGGNLRSLFSYGSGPAGSEAYCRFLSLNTENLAGELCSAYPFGSFGKVLDAGGNDGSFLSFLCRRFPRLSGTCFDLPGPCRVGERKARREGLSARLKFVPGDFFTDRLPEGAGLVVFKGVLNDWKDAQAMSLLAKAMAALPPGGAVAVAEHLDDASALTPDGCLFDLAFMNLLEPGGRFRRREDYFSMLRAAGFADLRCSRRCSFGFRVISGRKPRRGTA